MKHSEMVEISVQIEKLFEAMCAHMYREARRLGLHFDSSQIADLSRNIFLEPELQENQGQMISAKSVREDDLFDTYHTENLELQDYLHLISTDMRKSLGQYMTPSLVVNYILSAAGYKESEDILGKKIIDPACGSGIFLVEAARIYLSASRKNQIPIDEWYFLLQVDFYGIDIDPLACGYTRFNLGLLLTPAILFWAEKNKDKVLPPLKIYCLDTIKNLANELDTPDLFEQNPDYLSLYRRFDFVVGNPPYHKISGLSSDIKKVFHNSLYGHPNAYGLFLHAGLEMLGPRGVLGFILPRSMLSGLYFKNLRNFVEHQADLLEITLIVDRKKVFENVLQGTMILVTKRKESEEGSSRSGLASRVRISVVRSKEEFVNNHFTYVEVCQNDVIRPLNGTNIWFVADSRKAYEIVGKIIDSHPLLSSPQVNCPAKTGTIVWNRVKPLLRSEPEEGGSLPIIWATDVGRFKFSYSSHRLNRPAYLEINDKTIRLRTFKECLLIQRVTADEQPRRLVGCVLDNYLSEHPEGYFVENHLNIIQPSAVKSKIDLYYILGIICSDIMEFFFRSMNGNTQVSATELNLMPIPRGLFEECIAALARRLQQTGDRNNRKILEIELNNEVAEAYGLSFAEMQFIQAELGKIS